MFIAYLSYAKYTLLTSQEDIVRNYDTHLRKVDSMYIALYKNIQTRTYSTTKLVDTFFVEFNASLKNNQRSTVAPYNKLDIIFSKYFEKQEQTLNRFNSQIQRDSLILGAERLVLNEQVKNYVDLHLGQIENDYTNITIWAAVLTIIFLIFGFYSMFKMEHIIQQGEKSNEVIDLIKKEAENRIEQIKKSKSSYEDQCGDIISTLNKSIIEKMENLDKEINIRIMKVDDMISRQVVQSLECKQDEINNSKNKKNIKNKK